MGLGQEAAQLRSVKARERAIARFKRDPGYGPIDHVSNPLDLVHTTILVAQVNARP